MNFHIKSPINTKKIRNIRHGYKVTEFPDIDECLLANPCGNGAQCINTDGSYKCLCTPGWTGINCTDGESKPTPCTGTGTTCRFY